MSSAVEDAHPELFSDHNVSGNVYVSSDFIHKLIMDNNPITFAVRDGSSLLNSNSDWSWTFARTNDKKTLLGDSRLTKVNLMRLSLGIDVGISSLDHMFDGDHLDSIANIDFSSIQPSVDSNGKQLPITTRAMFKGNNLKQLDGYVLNDDGTVNNQPGTGNTSLGYFFSGGYLSDVSEMFANNQLYTLDNNDSLMDSIAGYDGKGIVADRMFANNHLTDLSNVGFLSNVNLSSGIGMFENNNISKLPDQLYFGDNQTTPTPDLSYMFANNQLTELPQVDWVISPSDQIKKLNLTGMFANNKIADVSKAADWSEMTQPEIVHFGEVNLAGFLENNQVSDLKGFRDWNTSTVTDMSSLFKHNKIVNTDPISKWDTSLLTDAHDMFYDNQISSPTLSWKKTGKLTNTSDMFAYNLLTNIIGLGLFDTANVTDMHDIFKHNKLLGVADLALNTSKVTNMSGMFSDNQLTKFDLITPLDMASVIDMHDMFKNNQFKQIDTSNNSGSYWDLVNNLNAKDMSGVFDGNPVVYADLNYWNLTNAEKLGNFINADTNSVVIVKPADLAKMSGTSRTYDGQTLPVIDTKQNQLYFGSDTVDMPTVYVATDKTDARQKILADINTKLADYQKTHLNYDIKPVKPLDQLTELVDLANAKFTAVKRTLPELDTNDAFALDPTHGLHEHKNVNENGGYNKDFWGTLDVSKFTTVKNGDNLEITGYTGDTSKIIVPNIADFWVNGLDQGAKQVIISSNMMHDLAKNATRIGLSKTNNQKVVASNSIWQNAFGGLTINPQTGDNSTGGIIIANPKLTIMDLHNLDTSNITNMSAMFNGGSNLTTVGDLSNWDTSNVTNMHNMFYNSQISDLTPLANWKTDNVTDMSFMFYNNQISDLAPLANWKTDNVANMRGMFYHNRVSDLTPLANWKTDNVTDMSFMFYTNQISDLMPLTNWKTDNVTNMSSMLHHNQISDLTPLANWKTDNVTNMSYMFSDNQISDLASLVSWKTDNVTNMRAMFQSNKISNLTPLANWKTDNVTDMSYMFYSNKISDLAPLADWKTDNVTDMSSMFYTNQISDLAPLADWKTDNVTDMSFMFAYNQISGLTSLANWNTDKVTNMHSMFDTNQISDLASLVNWKTDNVTNMRCMFYSNQISDLTPLINWKTDNATDMSSMFSNNHINYADFTKWNFNKVQYLGQFIDQFKPSVIIVNGANKDLLSGRSQSSSASKTPDLVINTKQNQLHFDSDAVDMPTVYVATDKADTRQKILADINAKLAGYQANHADKMVIPTIPLDQLTELVDLANANFITVQKKNVQTQDKTVYKGTTLTTKDLVTNVTDFPEETTFAFADNSEPKWSQPGTYDVKITATYPVTVDNQQYTIVTDPVTVKVMITDQMQFTITYWDDTDNKQIAQFGISDRSNGGYNNSLKFPNNVNSKNYQSVSVSGVPDGVTIAGDVWKPFTDSSCNWMIPNYKWDSMAASVLFGTNVVVHLVHKTQDATNTDSAAQETRTVTANFVKINNDGKAENAPFNSAILNVYYKRSAIKDLVTNKVTYGDWQLDTNKGTNGYNIVKGSWNILDNNSNVIVKPADLDGYVIADLDVNGKSVTDFGKINDIKDSIVSTIYYVPKSLTEKTVNRVINVTEPNQPGEPSVTQATTQSATLTRPVRVNASDSGVVFDGFTGSGWTTDRWERFGHIASPNNYTRIVKQVVTNLDGTTTETTLNLPFPRPIPAQIVNSNTPDTVINVTFTAVATATLSDTNESTYTGSPITVDDLNNGSDDDSIYVTVTGPVGGSHDLHAQAGDVEFSSDNGQTWSIVLPTNAGTYELRWTTQGKQNIIKAYGNNSIKWVDADGNSTISGTATYVIKPKLITDVMILGDNQNKAYDGKQAVLDLANLTINGDGVIADHLLTMPKFTASDFDWYDAKGNKLNVAPVNAGNYEAHIKPLVLSSVQLLNPNYQFDTITGAIKYTINANASIAYIDDTTGKTLMTDTATGVFDSAIKFATDPVTKIADYVAKGYELVSNNFDNSKYTDNNNLFTVHLKHRIDTPTDTRANTVYEQIIHYQDDKGNKLADDTVIKADFHRDYSVDMVTNVPTWGFWSYVKGSLTQTGTHIDDLKDPGDRYNKVDGFDSFNFWIPFRTFENYHAQYSGLAASWSVANGDGYVSGPVSEQTVVYELNDQSVTYQFVDKTGKVVGTYTAPTGKIGLTVTIDSNAFKKGIPSGYALTDDNYQIPTSYTYDETINPTVKVPVSQLTNVTYQFVDKDGKVVGTYTGEQGKEGSTVTILKSNFLDAVPNGYYFVDNNFQVPTSYTYTDVINSKINVEVAKASIYTVNFFDDTDNEQYSSISWDGVDKNTHRLTGTVDELNKFVQDALIKIKYKSLDSMGSNNFDGNWNGDLSKYPVSAIFTTDFDKLATLPTADSNVTLHFKHATYDVSTKMPVWQAPTVQLSDQGMKVLIDALNSHSNAGPGSELQDITSSDEFKKLLPQIFANAQWTSGGLLISDQDGDDNWNLFNTAGSSGNLVVPIYQRPKDMVGLAHDKFYLDDELKALLKKAESNGRYGAAIMVGNMPMLTINAKGDAFDWTISDVTTNADSQMLIAKSIPEGYHANVLIPVASKDGNSVNYKQVVIDSKDLQDQVSLAEQINKTYGDSVLKKLTDINGIGGGPGGPHLDLEKSNDGRFKLMLTTPYGDFDELKGAAGLSDINESLLSDYYSKAYVAAINEALKQSKENYTDATIESLDPSVPLTMLYTLSADSQQVTIKYVDQNGKTVKSTAVNGHTGEQTNLTFAVPDNYFATSELPAAGYIFTTDNKDIVIPVEEKQTTTGDPTTSDKDVLNLINYTDENGKVVKTDKVTGKIDDKITVNVPNGYYFADGKVPTVVITENPEQTVKIVKDQHETGEPTTSSKDTLNLINYTDENGKVIKTDKVTGKIGDKITVNVPDGYQFVDGKVPTVVITENPEQTVKIVKNQHETGEPITSNKDVLNLINYTDENGKVVKTDNVTGKIGDTVKVDIPDGYHFVDSKVPTVVITNDPEQTVEIVKDQHETGDATTSNKNVLNLINYTDENGNVIKTDKVTGKIGDTIKVNIPDGYHFVDGKVPTVVTTNDPEQTVEIVKDQHETGDSTTSDKDVLNLINYTDENGNVIKTGKVTGKIGDRIKLNMPAEYHLDKEQSSLLTISDNPVQTVKIVKNQTAVVDQPTINTTGTQAVKPTTTAVNYSKNSPAGRSTMPIAKRGAVTPEHASTSARRLPQTGNQRETGLIALGLVSGLLGLIGLKKKKQD